MKPKSLRFVVLFFVLFNCSLLIVNCPLIIASVPPQMTYQGKVTNTDGVGLTDTLEITFSLWTAATDADSLWGET
ncbi:hypothetical protein JXI42_04450 [bacterium]|nr:hypothetical protein [bacterium]